MLAVATPPVAATTPTVVLEPRLRNQKEDIQFKKFLDVFKQLHINIPLVEAIENMPSYAKFLKDILSKKNKLTDYETVSLIEECTALLSKKIPPKLKDTGCFTIPCSIGGKHVGRALCDLGASINLTPLSVFNNLGIGEARPTTVTLQLADKSIAFPKGKIEDVLVQVDKFIFPAAFIILDFEADKDTPILLGRPFLATDRTIIDIILIMSKELLSMGFQSKPPVLCVGEYAQWKRRMVQHVPKPYQYFNEREKALHKIDEEALIYLTMAIPNDIYNRVDSRETAKVMWDELERQFQGTERSIQAKLNQSINAYEGFHAKEVEALVDTYNRFNVILNDLRRNGMNKSVSEINYKFIKNLNPEWKSYAINIQMTKNMAQEDDYLSLLSKRKKGSSSKSVSSSKYKSKKSRAFLTELSQSSSEASSNETEMHSDDDIQWFVENLALITKQFQKSFGKKRFSKSKYEGYRKDRSEKYKPRFGKKEGKKKEKRDEKREEKRDEKKEEKREEKNESKFER
ncbi:hypothetical protein L6452_14988 [Arctium lappa]|uniref:Uncharacterized protein n=1 Tax=Arctium lappa TaxID=4217 RepID=A0ACB9CMI2_ARCLA|nr:hypothetical protein L6452_14988 [Arctium lappa]